MKHRGVEVDPGLPKVPESVLRGRKAGGRGQRPSLAGSGADAHVVNGAGGCVESVYAPAASREPPGLAAAARPGRWSEPWHPCLCRTGGLRAACESNSSTCGREQSLAVAVVVLFLGGSLLRSC